MTRHIFLGEWRLAGGLIQAAAGGWENLAAQKVLHVPVRLANRPRKVASPMAHGADQASGDVRTWLARLDWITSTLGAGYRHCVTAPELGLSVLRLRKTAEELAAWQETKLWLCGPSPAWQDELATSGAASPRQLAFWAGLSRSQIADAKTLFPEAHNCRSAVQEIRSELGLPQSASAIIKFDFPPLDQTRLAAELALETGLKARSPLCLELTERFLATQ